MAKDITANGYLSGNITAKAGLSGDMTASGALGQTVVVGGTILRPATTTSLGGIIVGEDLQITQSGVLSVTKANQVEQDNTHPITAAAVYAEVGNISALLQTI